MTMKQKTLSLLVMLAAFAACSSSGGNAAGGQSASQSPYTDGAGIDAQAGAAVTDAQPGAAGTDAQPGAAGTEAQPGAAATVALPDGEGERFGTVVFDRTVHNFGDILTSDGPQSCSFTVTNEGEKAIAIYEVVSSCGCTNVTWTRSPIRPGESGTISATYDNTDGPFPFDKTLTVYVSGVAKPVILHLRGSVHETAVPLAEAFPVRMMGGKLGLKTAEMQVGNILQGQSRSDEILIANLTESPLNVSFSDVSEGLFLRVRPNPVPPRSTAKLRATVSSDPSRWGIRRYTATVGGDGTLSVAGYTMADFSGCTEEERARAARIEPAETTVDFGVVKPGTVVEASFRLVNEGASPLVLYARDADRTGAVVTGGENPVPPGETCVLSVRYDTAGQPLGENLLIITLTTNAPERPILHLFLAGALKN